jgi:hypothetical protein
LISRTARKLAIVSHSSTEAEYKALANATSGPVWFEALVRELGISLNHVFGVRILTPHAFISTNQFSMPTNHIEIDYHFV